MASVTISKTCVLLIFDENIQIKLIYTKYLLVAIGYWQSSLNKRIKLRSNILFFLKVGVKGNPKGVNQGLDCDVIVAEVTVLYFIQYNTQLLAH